MLVLDCENYESTMACICDIYQLTETEVSNFLLSVDLEKDYEEQIIYKDCSDYLKDLFELRFGQPVNEIESVCWFHLSRVAKCTDFSEGLLPLGDVLPYVWDMLENIVGEGDIQTNLAKMRAKGVCDFQYGFKTNDSLHFGPYAMLVREVAFNASLVSNHDYLECPEIIEDICNGYETEFGENIYDVVVDKLIKCIVKFQSSQNIESDLLGHAMLYCYCKLGKQEFSAFANTCFDSHGSKIPRESIVKIEFL